MAMGLPLGKLYLSKPGVYGIHLGTFIQQGGFHGKLTINGKALSLARGPPLTGSLPIVWQRGCYWGKFTFAKPDAYGIHLEQLSCMGVPT